MRTSGLALVLVLATSGPASADPTKLSLDELTARSLDGTRARMAHRDTEAAEARSDEAGATRLPKLTATAFVAPSPEITCADAACSTTDPEGFAIRLSGAFGGGSLSVVQPLYTFGKIGAARDAAAAGVTAQRALEDAAAGDLALEAARAYWGLKLARELVAMLDDGVAEIQDAGARLDERLADGDGEATIQDRQRLQTLLAEAKIQLTEARAAEGAALAGVRAIAAAPSGDDVDVDDAPLEAVALALDDAEAYVDRAQDGRPEIRAAKAGARAFAGLADLEDSYYWPDVALVGTLGITRAQGVEDVPNAIFAEPYNSTTGGLALVLRWNVEPWTTNARVDRAQALVRKADELVELAGTGATLEARSAHAEASEARDRVTAATEGETAARAWLASVLQADAIGTAETRDLADAYIAWFTMRARLATSIFQWNVATVRLGRATGEFTATAGRR